MNNQRHFAKLRGEEIIVIGYKRSMNACMICRLNSLPQDEAMQLRRIASSVNAQEQDYLVKTLQVETHKSNQDWFTYLVSRLHRGDGSVSSIPLKEIEEMHQGQKAFFKGYGKSVTEAEKNVTEDDSSKENVPQAYISEEEKKEQQKAAAMAIDPGQQAMMQLMKQLVDGQNELTNTLNGLSEKLEGNKSTKPAKKPATKRRTSSKVSTATKVEGTGSQEASA